MNARTTLIGTETHLKAMYNKSIADNWEFTDPEFSELTLDKKTLLATIINKGGQFEPLHAANPLYFHEACWYWWNRWERTFGKWLIVLNKEYEPLWNTEYWLDDDDEEHKTGTNDTDFTGSIDNDTTYTKGGTQKEVTDEDTTGTSTTNSSGEEDNKVSAYDSDTYQPHDKTNTTATSTTNSSGTDDITKNTTVNESGSGTDDTATHNITDNDTTEDRTYAHREYKRGNIGVMSSQDLLGQELRIQEWNVYNHIADIFCNEMLIRVY